MSKIDFYKAGPPDPYAGQRECPDYCEYLGEAGECTAIDCVRELDEDTLGDRKFHEGRDE